MTIRQRELLPFEPKHSRGLQPPVYTPIMSARLPWIAIALAGLLSVACGSVHTRPCGAGGQRMVEDKLYLGTQTPDGAVTPAQWSQFLSEVVTPRFPQGLSVWTASGQWRSADGSITREDSYVLDLLHDGDAANEAAVREIAADYQQRFRQEAVMRVRTPACVSF